MTILTYLILALGALALLNGAFALGGGSHFLRHTRRELARKNTDFHPRASVLLPCKGLDARFEQTLRAIRVQEYPEYEVICAVESSDDPACAAIQRIAAEPGRVPLRCVVSRPAERCSQKIMNLLAALEVVSPTSEVFAFLDSDAVPPPHWLASLVDSLRDPAVGASTGYRWYVPAASLVSQMRCLWNGGTLTFLGDHDRNFCWGGSTAVRRRTFEELNIAGRWAGVLSEDFEVMRAVRGAKLRIYFAARCVLPSDDQPHWGEFLRFARRQMVITRVCHPPIWIAAALMVLVFNGGFWGPIWMAVLTMAGVWPDAPHPAIPLSVAAGVYILAALRAAQRQKAVAEILPDPALRSGAWFFDVFCTPLNGSLNFGLIIASGISRRFWWRDILYEMRTPEDVVILARRAASQRALPAMAAYPGA